MTKEELKLRNKSFSCKHVEGRMTHAMHHFADQDFHIWTDKNKQICDISPRIGHAFDRLHNRPYELNIHWDVMEDEYLRVKNEQR